MTRPRRCVVTGVLLAAAVLGLLASGCEPSRPTPVGARDAGQVPTVVRSGRGLELEVISSRREGQQPMEESSRRLWLALDEPRPPPEPGLRSDGRAVIRVNEAHSLPAISTSAMGEQNLFIQVGRDIMVTWDTDGGSVVMELRLDDNEPSVSSTQKPDTVNNTANLASKAFEARTTVEVGTCEAPGRILIGEVENEDELRRVELRVVPHGMSCPAAGAPTAREYVEAAMFRGSEKPARRARMLLAANGETGRISAGYRLPFSQVSAQGVNTTFHEAQTELELTRTKDPDALLLYRISFNRKRSTYYVNLNRPYVERFELNGQIAAGEVHQTRTLYAGANADGVVMDVTLGPPP